MPLAGRSGPPLGGKDLVRGRLRSSPLADDFLDLGRALSHFVSIIVGLLLVLLLLQPLLGLLLAAKCFAATTHVRLP